MAKLFELAKVLRSKNSGPFEFTMDILFDEKEVYERVKQSHVMTKEKVAEAYNISVSDIHHFVFFDPALGIKITMARTVSSGTAGDRDVYGAQQHAPLMNLEIDGSR
ncbi:DUF4387 domain-containing protein [Robertmurraya andreesenii]|uniref:Cob(I)alamin adenosyltransferase n=1 Tax=Anoxybacillus andreesenii TaxID=1325932 RepID=A0ABT9V1S6_9BACL|nr:DUF4387 domain-containing protein [Robertmurraya andreesenii]MDQ0154893.1 cob(I)alamin adenosyltransferase [Robertmurraya andreesenii]